MKKRLQKIISLMLAMMLVLGMGVTALAADEKTDANPYKITVPGGDTHTYKIYQIFKGDWSPGSDPDETGVLSTVYWGQNVKADADKLVEQSILTDLEGLSGEKAILAYLATYVDLGSTPFETITGDKDNSITKYLPGGYYLIKDTVADNATDDSATLYIVLVVRDTKINRKADEPTVDKEVQDNDDSKTWDDSADYNINDEVPFRLIGSLPKAEKFARYESYEYIFHDTLSKGLEFNGDVEVYVTEDEDTLTENNKLSEGANGYTVATGTGANDSTTITIAFADLKKALPAGYTVTDATKIVVRYSATLTEGAVIGNPGNPNEVYLEYSNNPNEEGKGHKGKTPPKKVVVFTFEFNGTKIDGKTLDENGNVVVSTKKLQGAEFVLYRGTDEAKEYVVIADGKVSDWDTDETNASKITSDANGLFNISGLDAGTYYLKETKAPTGYNLLQKPIKITVTATYTTDANGTITETLSAVVEVEEENSPTTDVSQSGHINFNVVNFGGVELPETGGIGTTIFYILGGVLVLGCGVILMARRRKG